MTLNVILAVEVMADRREKAPEARCYPSQLESVKYKEYFVTMCCVLWLS